MIVLNILGYFLEQFQRFSLGFGAQKSVKLSPYVGTLTDFIFRTPENFDDNQKYQAGHSSKQQNAIIF